MEDIMKPNQTVKKVDPKDLNPKTGTLKAVETVTLPTGPSYGDAANLTKESISLLTDRKSVIAYLGMTEDPVIMGLLTDRLNQLLDKGSKETVLDAAAKREQELKDIINKAKKDFHAGLSTLLKNYSKGMVDAYKVLGFTQDGKRKASMEMFSIQEIVEAGKDMYTVSCPLVVQDKVPIRSLPAHLKTRVKMRKAERARDEQIQAEWDAYLKENE
jgi:hypothetical protein